MIIRLSAALSLDGYIDDTAPERLILSSEEDWREVRRARAASDALLVGAGTIRCDNPALVIRDEALHEERRRRGLAPDPVKVTLSRSGNLDPEARFFTEGTGEKIVLLGVDATSEAEERLQTRATVIRSTERTMPPAEIVARLEARGIRSLFVEGGTQVLTEFLTNGTADYLRVAVAPFFVGESAAPRFVDPGRFAADKDHRMRLLRTGRASDMAILEYGTGTFADDFVRLEEAIALASQCPKSPEAYSVGCLIVTRDGSRFAGHSRETAPTNHAEEEALTKALRAGANLIGATLYSSMEPCSTRKSKPLPCSDLIIENGISKVVFAAYEPLYFVNCSGAKKLIGAGVETLAIGELSDAALAANAHILNQSPPIII